MKICLLCAANNVHSVQWANLLSRRGYDISVVTLHKSQLNKLDNDIIEYKLLFPAPWGYYFNVIQLRKLLKKIKPDILHAHYAGGYGTLLRLSAFSPSLLSVWGSDVYTVPEKSVLKKWCIKKNLKYPDWVCSTSQHMAIQTIKLQSLVKHLTVVPFGVDMSKFLNGKIQRSNAPITIGTVKKMHYYYGIDTLINAFAIVYNSLQNSAPQIAKRMRLLLVGDGGERLIYEKLTHQLDIADVTTFVGDVLHDNVVNYLNMLDVYVCVSRAESFGVAVIEASACELPVVVSNIQGLPEVVEDGSTGFLVEPENPANLAKIILKLLINESLRRRLGRAGRKFVEQNYGWDNCLERMEVVYFNVVEERTKAGFARNPINR